MSSQQRQDLPVLRRRSRRVENKFRKRSKVRYYVNWIYPTLFVTAMVFLVSMYLCQYAKLVSVQYQVTNLTREKSELLDDYKEIKVNIESLESLERIEKVAKNDLKMIYPAQRISLSLGQETNTAQMAEEEMPRTSR